MSVWSVADERRDHDPDKEDDEQRSDTGHEEFSEGVLVPSLPPSPGPGVTFFGRTVRGFPFWHGSSVTQPLNSPGEVLLRTAGSLERTPVHVAEE